MKITGINVAVAALLLTSCLGPETPGTEVAVSIHYSFAPSQTAGDADPNGGLAGQGPFDKSLDQYSAVVRVRVDVPGSGSQEQDVTLGYGQAASGLVDAEFYVESGDGRTVSVIGYSLDGAGTFGGFETATPVPVDMSGPDASVDVYPDLMDRGTVSGSVRRGGTGVSGGSVVIGDPELSVGFPAAPVERDPTSGQSRFSIPGVPLNRGLDIYYVDPDGVASYVGTDTLTKAQETYDISL